MPTTPAVACQICGEPAFYVAGDRGLCARDFAQLMGSPPPPAAPPPPKPRKVRVLFCVFCRAPLAPGEGYSLSLRQSRSSNQRAVAYGRVCTACAQRRLLGFLHRTSEATREAAQKKYHAIRGGTHDHASPAA